MTSHRWLLALCSLAVSCGGERAELPADLLLQADFEGTCTPAAVAKLDTDLSGPGRTYAAGVEGRAVHFDGSGGAVQYAGIGSLPLTNAFTLEFFFRADGWRNPYGPGVVLESMVSHSDTFTIALQPDSWVLSARLHAGTAEAPATLVGGLVTPGEWHHAALVLDPVASEARLVLDGEVVAAEPATGHLRLLEGMPLTLGTWRGKNQAFAGRLDSLRLWSRALTNAELAARAALAARPAS